MLYWGGYKMAEWLDGIDAAQFLAAGSAWGRAAWAGDSGDSRDSWDALAAARRAHAATLARHGVCPVCFSRLPRVSRAPPECPESLSCRRCARRLVRLQTPGDGPRHGLVPLMGNLYLADEVARHRIPLHRGENYVRSWNCVTGENYVRGENCVTGVTPPLPDLEA